MRILYAADTDLIGSLGYCHKNSLENMGHDLICYDYTRQYSKYHLVNFITRRSEAMLSRIVRRIEKEIFLLLDQHKPDLFLTIKGELFRGEFIRSIKTAYKIPVINWFADPVNQLYNPPYLLLSALKEYDYCFVKDSYFLKQVKLLSPQKYLSSA